MLLRFKPTSSSFFQTSSILLRNSPKHKGKLVNFASDFHSFTSNDQGFSTLLKRCQRPTDLKPLKSLLVVQGVFRNERFLGEFLGSCFDLGAPDLALSSFQNVQNPSLFLQNVILKGLSNYGLHEDVLWVYINRRNLGGQSDNFMFPFVIKACSVLGASRIGKSIHCIVLKQGYERNVVVMTALVDFYAKNGFFKNAVALVDKIPEPDLVSLNALMAGYSSNGLDQEVFDVFRKIQVMGLKPNASSLATVIPVCTRLGCSMVGRSLQGLAFKSGYFSSDFLVPALISMYATHLDLASARKLYDYVVKRNITVWNSMIYAYTQNDEFSRAFELFRLMLQTDIKPESVTFVSIVPSCGKCSGIWHGEVLHACAIKHGSSNLPTVQTALVSMYAKLGHIHSAEFVFNSMPGKSLFSWNAMISAYVNSGLTDASLIAFHEMLLAGFTPDAITVISILSASSRLEDIFLGKSMHAFAIRRRIEMNLNVKNALLTFYSSCSQVSSSFKLFQRMPARNTTTWNTLISGCVYNGQVEKADMLLYQMQKEKMNLDLVTLLSILPSYANSEKLQKGMAVHGYAIKSGFASDVSLMNALIIMYCTCGDVVAGKSLFENMPERSLVTWNSLMTGCKNNLLHSDVRDLFAQMMKANQLPDHVSLLNLLHASCTLLQGKSVHAFAIRMGMEEETTLLSSLIFMYARFDDMKSSVLLFQMGENGSISLWNAIISANFHGEKAKTAVSYFCRLLLTRLEPDKVTLLSLIAGCVQINCPDLNKSVMSYVICKGFHKDIAVSNALIDLCATSGNILLAKKLFEHLPKKDTISWNVMINSCGLHGDGEAALELFSRMKLSGIRCDTTSYSSVLSACSHCSLVEQGWMLFNSMVDDGIHPTVQHYSCMIDLLGRNGYVDEAYHIVHKLPFRPSVSMLESLLGACAKHIKVELGEKVAQMLLDIDPNNSVSYLMLSNMYAAAENWTDATRARSGMQVRTLKKIPGLSLIVN